MAYWLLFSSLHFCVLHSYIQTPYTQRNMAYQPFKIASKWQCRLWHTDFCFVPYTSVFCTVTFRLSIYSTEYGIPTLQNRIKVATRTMAYWLLFCFLHSNFGHLQRVGTDCCTPSLYVLNKRHNIWLNKAPDNIFIFIVIVLYMYITNLFNYFLPLLLFS